MSDMKDKKKPKDQQDQRKRVKFDEQKTAELEKKLAEIRKKGEKEWRDRQKKS